MHARGLQRCVLLLREVDDITASSRSLAASGATHSNSGSWCRNQVNCRLAYCRVSVRPNSAASAPRHLAPDVPDQDGDAMGLHRRQQRIEFSRGERCDLLDARRPPAWHRSARRSAHTAPRAPARGTARKTHQAAAAAAGLRDASPATRGPSPRSPRARARCGCGRAASAVQPRRDRAAPARHAAPRRRRAPAARARPRAPRAELAGSPTARASAP